MKQKDIGTKAPEIVSFSTDLYDPADWQQKAQGLLERRWQRLQRVTDEG